MTLQLESSEPVAIEASFTPDVAWMWPAGLGAGYVEWDSTLRVFNLGEEEHRFYAVAGSPGASDIHQAYSTNYSSATTDGFQFGPAVKGSATYHFVLAASFKEKKGRMTSTRSSCRNIRNFSRRRGSITSTISTLRSRSPCPSAICRRRTTGRASAKYKDWWSIPSRAPG